MTNQEKIKLINNYMEKCPFIEFFTIIDCFTDTATIKIAFDDEYKKDFQVLKPKTKAMVF
jgi:hypothetical protein